MSSDIKMELAFPYDINIMPTVNGGCIVNVGCARLSYSSPSKMLTDLRKYLADPEGHEKAYNACNKTRGGNALAEPERPTVVGSGAGRTVESLGPPNQERPQTEDRGPDDSAGDTQAEATEETDPG